MRVLICSFGSRGDCQPYLALSAAFQQAGHEVALFTNDEFSSFVQSLNVTFFSSGGDFKPFFLSKTAQAAFKANNMVQFAEALAKYEYKTGLSLVRYRNMCDVITKFQPDVVLAGNTHWQDAIWIPRVFRIPSLVIVLSHAFTLDPTKAPFGLPSLPCAANAPIWKVTFAKYVNDLKKTSWAELPERFGLAPEAFLPTGDELLAVFGADETFSFLPYLILMDERIVGHRPIDQPWFRYLGSPWVARESCVGEDWGDAEKAALDAFVKEDKEAPVYMGWGSVKAASNEWTVLLAVRSLMSIGRRGVILGGWADLSLGDISAHPEEHAYAQKHVHFVKAANHEELFPQCSVILHHGGSGTTMASMRSGTPTVVTPIFYDQYESAVLVNSTGAGVGTAQLLKLKPEDIANALTRCLTDAAIIAKAGEVGRMLRGRDAASEGVSVVASFFDKEVKTGEYWKNMDAHFEKRAKTKKCCA